MFNFIFESKLGDILAPVTNPNQQLFLAIQHHKQQDVQTLFAQCGPESCNNADSGYGAIHVACRYNNRLALDLILGSGIAIDFPDRSGNTPLHYASKNGHLELCKFLVGRGASLMKRNSDGKTPYDVTENHMVRQYLLPLQLTAERQHQEATGTYSDPGTISFMSGQSGMMQGSPSGPSAGSYPPPPPPIYAPPPLGATSGQGMGYPPPHPSYSAAAVPPPQYSAPPPFSSPATMTQSETESVVMPPRAPAMAAVSPSTTMAGGERRIQPDGFHSSASDPVLQRKYGHIKENISIAPPPTGVMTSPVITANANAMATSAVPPAAPSYSMYSSPGGGYAPPLAGPPPAASVFSRYVAYDAHTNSPMAVPPPVQTAVPTGAAAAAAAAPVYQPPPLGVAGGVQVPPPYDAPTQTQTASYSHSHSPAHTASIYQVPPLGRGSNLPPLPFSPPPASASPSAPMAGLTLSIPSHMAGTGTPKPASPQEYGINGGKPLVNVSPFNVSTDSIVSADSSSSSIL